MHGTSHVDVVDLLLLIAPTEADSLPHLEQRLNGFFVL